MWKWYEKEGAGAEVPMASPNLSIWLKITISYYYSSHRWTSIYPEVNLPLPVRAVYSVIVWGFPHGLRGTGILKNLHLEGIFNNTVLWPTTLFVVDERPKHGGTHGFSKISVYVWTRPDSSWSLDIPHPSSVLKEFFFIQLQLYNRCCFV